MICRDLSRSFLRRASPGMESGALAAFGYANKKVINSLTGIAIAVALMPPLCTIGVGVGKLDFDMACGASLLLARNVAGDH